MIREMIKKYGLSYTIHAFHLIDFALAAVLLLFLQGPITLLLCILLGIHSKENFLYDAVAGLSPIISYGLWTAFLVARYKTVIYRFQTGRDHQYDRNHYHRSTGDLTDYFKDADPHRLDSSIFPYLPWKSADGIIFGTDAGRLISIPSDSEGNIAVFGPPGSGKTSGIAIMSAMQFSGSVLAVDIKGDLYNYVHKNSNRKILRFAPDHPDARNVSCHFDPLEHFQNMDETEQKLYLKNMATILIPDEGGNNGNYFSSRARKIFQGIAWLMLDKNAQTSFPDIVHAVLQGNIFDWVKQALSSDCEQAKECLASFYGSNEKNVSGAYDSLANALIDFSTPVMDDLLGKSENSISTRLLDDGYDIYLQIRQEHLTAFAPIFTLITQSISQEFSNRPDSSTGIKNRPILMLLDEFPQLSFSYDLINSNLSTLRSKSVICMLIQQNLSQLDYRYRNEGTRSILGNCNYQLILGSNDITSSKVFSDMIGTRKILKVSNSFSTTAKVSTNKSVQETEERIFPPEFFGDLSDQAILYFKGKYAKLKKLNCYKN